MGLWQRKAWKCPFLILPWSSSWHLKWNSFTAGIGMAVLQNTAELEQRYIPSSLSGYAVATSPLHQKVTSKRIKAKRPCLQLFTDKSGLRYTYPVSKILQPNPFSFNKIWLMSLWKPSRRAKKKKAKQQEFDSSLFWLICLFKKHKLLWAAINFIMTIF